MNGKEIAAARLDRPAELLYFEDNPTDSLLVRAQFEKESGLAASFTVVERLGEGLSRLRKKQFDLALLDLNLPDSRGLPSLVALRNAAPTLPVVVVSGVVDDQLALDTLSHGAQDCLRKGPTLAPQIANAVRFAIRRQQMQAALLHAEKIQALGTLAGGIAHDFNNILLAVSGNARLALEQLEKNHPAYANILEIANACGRAIALTSKILSFSRDQETNRQPVELQPVVEEALSLLRTTLPARIALTQNFTRDLPPILADASQVQQILVNLATNAVDAIGDRPGVLEVTARPVHVSGKGAGLSAKLAPGDYVKLSVKDNGSGMEKQTMARIFEPFFTTKPQGRGTGMGLAVVHGIMKNHMGEVTAYSEVGTGTVFNLYFPVATAAPAQTPVARMHYRGEGQHILYVDDQEPLVLLVKRTLMRLGYRVTGFTDPADALEAVRKGGTEFQALVTDLSMPGMSGIDLAREVLRICPNMPVILTSGYIRPQDQELARQIGVRETIPKPDTVEELGNALHRWLRAAGDKDKEKVSGMHA